jgi:aspartate kinase
MKIVVQKFGGTSLSSPEMLEGAVQKVINAKRGGFQPVVVVSAIGRKGDPYATDTLINMNLEISKDIHPREMDLLMSCGEIISAVIFTNTLKSRGYEARAFTGGQAGIKTDQNFSQADILEIRPARILKSIESGRIPVVAGFQGITEQGDITTLGRGGSDITAVALGEAIGAISVEIYSDVDGIMTADPKIVPNASVLSQISYSDILELASKGAKVIHPRAIEYAIRGNMPVFIKSTYKCTPGTLISLGQERSFGMDKKLPKQVITGIAHITDRVQITIYEDLENLENSLKANAEAGRIVGPYGVPPIWAQSERFEAEQALREKHKNVDLSLYADYLMSADKVTVNPEPPVNCQEMYKLIDNVIQAMWTDKNADPKALLDKAAEDFQRDYLDPYNAQ